MLEGGRRSVTECGDAYIREIDAVGKGIVLMHDPYFIDMNNPESGGTYQMVQYVVPLLKTKGYKFVRVDEVPDIAALLPATQRDADAGARARARTARRLVTEPDPLDRTPGPCS